MSVLIKNMGKPKCCADCPICNDYVSCRLLDRNFVECNEYHLDPFESVFDDCPIIEASE